MKTPYVALYPTDFLADVGHLGNTELGIYTRLLLVYYRDGRPLPPDTDKLRRIAMTFSPEESKALTEVLNEFFIRSAQPDGTIVYRHKRADKEIERASTVYEHKVAGAAKARAARELKSTLTSELISSRYQPENQNQNQKEKEKRRGATRPLLPGWLPEDVWADWHQYRNARKGWTPKARELSMSTLADLRDAGHDPRAVVNQSIERGWTGLFPVKQSDSAAVDSFVARIKALEGGQ